MKTSLYLPNGYIDEDRICDSTDSFIFQIGPRGTGKSYGILKYIVNRGLKFLMLRRTQTEAETIGSDLTSPFRALERDYENLQISMFPIKKNISGIRAKIGEEDSRHIGYLCSLSTFANVKGMDLSDVEVIFYDEFIPERHQRPIKNEFNALMNVFESVNRNRELQGRPPCKLICAANATDIANPIFIGLEIVERVARLMRKGKEVYRDPERSLSVYMFMHSPISGKKAETVLYKLTAGSSFQDMALRNMFELDQRFIRPAPIREYKPVVRFAELVVYKHKGRQEYYCNCHAPGTVPAIYTSGDVDRERFVKRYAHLYIAYLGGRVYFETATAQVLFEKIYQ